VRNHINRQNKTSNGGYSRLKIDGFYMIFEVNTSWETFISSSKAFQDGRTLEKENNCKNRTKTTALCALAHEIAVATASCTLRTIPCTFAHECRHNCCFACSPSWMEKTNFHILTTKY